MPETHDANIENMSASAFTKWGTAHLLPLPGLPLFSMARKPSQNGHYNIFFKLPCPTDRART